MASLPETNIPVEKGSSSRESSFSPSPLDTTSIEKSPTQQGSSNIKVEEGEQMTLVPPPELTETVSDGETLANDVPSALPGTTLPTTSHIPKTESGVDHAVSTITNGVAPERVHAVSPSVSSFSEAKSVPAKADSPVSKSEHEMSQNALPISNDLPEPSKAVPQDAALVSIPRARLPQDRLGLLSDRIKEDARGDIEAWLALIEEHKTHNRIDDARNTYEAFFKLFPLAVSAISNLFLYVKTDTCHRPSNGRHT